MEKPTAVKPIRPVERPDPFDDPEWIFELKHDGFRALAYIENSQCRLVSRNNYIFPHWPGLRCVIRPGNPGDCFS